MTWLLILRLILWLPSLIPSLIEIYKLISEFENTGFLSIVELVKQCLMLLLGFPSGHTDEAKSYVVELKKELKTLKGKAKNGMITVSDVPNSLVELKTRLAAVK